ncbi:Uncharacterised protein YqeY/Aim41 like protein, partial [Aduncisulcus paluster]
QKNAAIEEFEKAERTDLVDEAKREIEVLMAYLPKQLTEEEIRAVVAQVISEVGAASQKDMGKVMGALAPKTKGKADNKLVSQVDAHRVLQQRQLLSSLDTNEAFYLNRPCPHE